MALQPEASVDPRAAAGQEQNEFSGKTTPDLVTAIHTAMLQLFQNVDSSGNASPVQKQALAQAIQSYRSAIQQLEDVESTRDESGGGNTPIEVGNADVLPA